MIGMAKALGCTVTAEGVETEEQLAILQELGCPRAQGSFFAQPVPAEGLPALLRTRDWPPRGLAEAA